MVIFDGAVGLDSFILRRVSNILLSLGVLC